LSVFKSALRPRARPGACRPGARVRRAATWTLLGTHVAVEPPDRIGV